MRLGVIIEDQDEDFKSHAYLTAVSIISCIEKTPNVLGKPIPVGFGLCLEQSGLVHTRGTVRLYLLVNFS